MTKRKLTLRCLCEGAIMLALAQVLGYIKLWQLPNGGSVTLSMLPIFVFCIRWGFGPGLLVSFAFGLLQLFLDVAYSAGWQSIIGDYLLAFAVMGFAGLFKGKKNGIYWGRSSARSCASSFTMSRARRSGQNICRTNFSA